ncbi:hypothetical protein UFOVP800_12 [uncultured Caudovirales phage]|uniref:Uncharacterized protein n=1 Tax=uncultured Caudovirales phage TaxID=2100421 RepID=A0A6J5NWV2_9CAUD|nr:hypothetical protein UFOVP800_12 [uncultured Caudovirales phage]
MAINPNTDFSSGAVLTAAQQNRFPRGVVAYGQATANVLGMGTAETTQITANAFTAVANRYYRITYYEPTASPAGGASSQIIFRIKNGATQLQRSELQNTGATSAANEILCFVVTTFAAGSVTITGTAQATAGSNIFRGANQIAQLIVEDIGPS